MEKRTDIAAKPKRATRLTGGSDAVLPASSQLLAKVADFYHQMLLPSSRGMDILESLGLASNLLIESARLGYADGTLADVLPNTAAVRDELKRLGLLNADGTETLLDCVVIPLLDEDGTVQALCGYHVGKARVIVSSESPTGIWNRRALAQHAEVYVAEG
jgi:hypothetical protein